MDIQIDGQGLEVTPSLREKVLQVIRRSTSHASRVLQVHVILKVEHTRRQSAHATVFLPGHAVHAEAVSEDLYEALDQLSYHLKVQVDKHKGKVTDHHRDVP